MGRILPPNRPRGSSMAKITSHSEQKAVHGILKSCGNEFWTAGSRLAEEKLYWYTNVNGKLNMQPFSYTNWYSSEPNNSGRIENCIFITHSDGKWYDYDCQLERPVVCEL